MLSTPTYFVASDVTANLNVESAVSEAAPSSVPTDTAEFVVPSATTHLPSFTANFVTVPSGILISPVLAPLEIVTSNSLEYASTFLTVILGATAIVTLS